MSAYRLTRRAERDLLDVFLYGIGAFGATRAQSYSEQMQACFETLARFPAMGRPCPSIAANLRRHERASHVILYEPVEGGVTIVAVVHRSSVRILLDEG